MNMHNIIQSIIYLISYGVLAFFTIYYWENQIWKAAKGFNGKLQLDEMLKLFSLYSIIIYGIEIIFGGVVFDINFGVFLLVLVGMAKLTDLPVFNKSKESNKEEH